MWLVAGNQRSITLLPHDFKPLLQLPSHMPSGCWRGIPISTLSRHLLVVPANVRTPRMVFLVHRVLLVLSHECGRRRVVAKRPAAPSDSTTMKMRLDYFSLLRGSIVVLELDLDRRRIQLL